MTMGIGLSLMSNFIYCIGLVLMPILYFTLKPNYPVFARGIGFGILLGLVLLLGAGAVCFWSIGHG